MSACQSLGECDGSCQVCEDLMFDRLTGDDQQPLTPASERERAEFRLSVWITRSEAAAVLQAIAERPEPVFERTRKAIARTFPPHEKDTTT